MNLNIKSFFKKLLLQLKKLLLPQVAIAGMEIKDVALRIARLQEGEFKKSAIVLEPGIIEAGKVKDKKQLTVYLKKLHDQFAKPKEAVPIIAILPSENFYTQVFSAPPLSQSGLEEAASLNLKSISPIDINAAYSDWQRLGSQEKEGKIELLGAFVNRLVVDEYVEALEKAGFSVVAVEFPALAIARAIKELAAGIDPEKPQVVLNVASDGIDFMVLKSGNLYFNYFVPWKNVLEENRLNREILFSDFKETIIRELQKVTTFYRSHWEGKLNKLILITQALGGEISDFIEKNFQFEVTELKLREWGGLQTSWFGVLGSALRGTMPRSKDDLISLMAVGTEKSYVQSEIKYFIKLWRNVIFAALGFLMLVFIFVDSFLVRVSGQLEKKLEIVTKVPESAEVAKLQEQARSFNQLVNKAFIAESQSPDWSPFFLKISALAKKDIVFTRIFIDQSTALINGKTSSELDAINFKNALVREGFKNVSLPLSDIVTNPDGSVSFAITFKL